MLPVDGRDQPDKHCNNDLPQRFGANEIWDVNDPSRLGKLGLGIRLGDYQFGCDFVILGEIWLFS